jgi:hypothetical protein
VLAIYLHHLFWHGLGSQRLVEAQRCSVWALRRDRKDTVMAQHITSFATTTIPKATKAEFLAALQPGDAIYCWGNAKISKIIEDIAEGPSHVLTAWRPWLSSPWLTIEATFPDLSKEGDSGVHAGLILDYVNGYDGNLVLTRRPSVSPAQIIVELSAGLAELGLSYNWQTEVSIAERKLLPWLKPVEKRNELYCSGLRQLMCRETVPYNVPGPDPATPEQCFTDPSTVAICALIKA